MSNVESASATQTPRQEVLERMAEQSPILGLPRLVTVDHMHKMLSAARRRVEDDHARQVANLKEITGLDHAVQQVPSDEEEMISVAGDTVTNHYHIPSEPQGSAVAAKLSPVVKYAGVGLAAVGLPLLGAWASTWFSKSTPTPPVQTAPAQPAEDRDTYLLYDFGIE